MASAVIPGLAMPISLPNRARKYSASRVISWVRSLSGGSPRVSEVGHVPEAFFLPSNQLTKSKKCTGGVPVHRGAAHVRGAGDRETVKGAGVMLPMNRVDFHGPGRGLDGSHGFKDEVNHISKSTILEADLFRSGGKSCTRQDQG